MGICQSAATAAQAGICRLLIEITRPYPRPFRETMTRTNSEPRLLVRIVFNRMLCIFIDILLVSDHKGPLLRKPAKWARLAIWGSHAVWGHNNSGDHSWRQPLRVDGPKASQRSIITYEIHFCIDQAKTHREVRFWFDLSYDATKVHGQMLRIKFCCFLFVFCRKVLPWDRVYKMARTKTRDT